MEEFFRLDSVRVLTRQEFFNPKIVCVYKSEAEMIKAQYNCNTMWSDDKLQIVGFKFANKTHLQDLLQHREKLPEKSQVWDFYQTPPDPISKMHRLIETIRNGGPQIVDIDDDED